MLRRISEQVDPELATEIRLRPLLEAAPRTGQGLPALSVGRHPSNDVVLQSSGIPLLLSRFHSAITFDGEQYTLVDKSNTNGTYVNSVQLPHLGRRILQFGDVVSFGGPENVLREGVSLRNPFRFVFEDCPSQPAVAAGETQGAGQQPVREWKEPRCDAPELATHTRRLPQAQPAAENELEQPPVAGPGDLMQADPAAAPEPEAPHEEAAAPQPASVLRRRRRGADEEQVGGDEGAQPAGEQSEEGRPARRARTSLNPAPAVPVEAPGVDGDANPAPVVAAVPPAAPAPAPAPAVDDEAGLPSLVPRTVAPLESDDMGAVCARLVNEAKCSICFELMVAPHALTCGHSFCGGCITSWMRKNPCCPVCRARTASPAYERVLDDMLTAIVEPRLGVEDMTERHRRKLEWAVTQREAARAQRALAAALSDGPGAAGRPRGGMLTLDRMPLPELQRLLRTTEQLQHEVGRLRSRMATAAVGAADTGAGAAGPDAADGAAGVDATARALYGVAVRVPGELSPRLMFMHSGPDGLLLPNLRPISAARARAIAAAAVPQPAAVTLEWSVDRVPSSLCVCHRCYLDIAQGNARVVHTTQQPSWAGVPAQTARAFYHPRCCPPGVGGPAALRGLDDLPADLRAAVVAELAGGPTEAEAAPEQQAAEPQAAAGGEGEAAA